MGHSTSFMYPRQSDITGLHLDPDLTPTESSMLDGDLERIKSLEIDGSNVRYFSDIFGGDSSSDVENYLGQRVHWIVSSTTDIDHSLFVLSRAMDTVSRFEDSGGSAGGSDTPQVVATNIGAAIWLTQLADGLPPVGLRLGNETVHVVDPRVGVIQLGNAYSSIEGNSMIRMATLVHEARHSDCTGGISRGDLALVREGKDPANKSCGHMHVICPPGHPYAGYPACDNGGWGAYAIESDFMAAVARTCTNCSETDRKVALAVFVDAASRVLNLDGLLAGKYGPPDMSSSTTVHP